MLPKKPGSLLENADKDAEKDKKKIEQDEQKETQKKQVLEKQKKDAFTQLKSLVEKSEEMQKYLEYQINWVKEVDFNVYSFALFSPEQEKKYLVLSLPQKLNGISKKLDEFFENADALNVMEQSYRNSTNEKTYQKAVAKICEAKETLKKEMDALVISTKKNLSSLIQKATLKSDQGFVDKVTQCIVAIEDTLEKKDKVNKTLKK